MAKSSTKSGPYVVRKSGPSTKTITVAGGKNNNRGGRGGKK